MSMTYEVIVAVAAAPIVAVGGFALSLAAAPIVAVGGFALSLANNIKGLSEIKKEKIKLENEQFKRHKEFMANHESKKEEYTKQLLGILDFKYDSKEIFMENYNKITLLDDRIEFIYEYLRYCKAKDNLWKKIHLLNETHLELDFDVNYCVSKFQKIRFSNRNELLELEKKLNSGLSQLENIRISENEKNIIESYITLDHSISEELKILFTNKIYNNLYKDVDEFNELNELNEIIDKIEAILNQINGLELTSIDCKEVENLANSAIEIFKYDSLSYKDRLNLLNLRLNILDDDYKKFYLRNKKIIVEKEEYLSLYKKYVEMCNVMGRHYEEYAFSIENSQQSCVEMKKLYEATKVDYLKFYFINSNKQNINNYFLGKGLELIYQGEIDNQHIKAVRELFLLPDGNVIETIIADNFTISNKIVGIKVDGYAFDKNKLRNSMKKHCHLLKELETSIYYSHGIRQQAYFDDLTSQYKEIEMPKNISLVAKNKVISRKNQYDKSAELSKMLVGE